MADVLDIDNAEEFEVDDEGDREFCYFHTTGYLSLEYITSTSFGF